MIHVFQVAATRLRPFTLASSVFTKQSSGAEGKHGSVNALKAGNSGDTPQPYSLKLLQMLCNSLLSEAQLPASQGLRSLVLDGGAPPPVTHVSF